MRIDIRVERNILGYNRYAYAMLVSGGLSHIFDVMRYELAFPVKRENIETLCEMINKGNLHSRVGLILAKYTWASTLAKFLWTPNRLLVGQTITPLISADVINLNCNFTATKPVRPSKFRHCFRVVDTVENILKLMLTEQAVLDTEVDALALESACWQEKKVTGVNLIKFSDSER